MCIELQWVDDGEWIGKCILKHFDDGFDYNAIRDAPIFDEDDEEYSSINETEIGCEILELKRIEDGVSFICAILNSDGHGVMWVLKERE